MKERIFNVLKMQRRTDEANAYLESLLREDPDDYFALIRLGVHESEKGDFQKALPRFERSRRLKPGELESNYHLGVILFRLNRGPEALPILMKAARMNPKDLEVAEMIQVIQAGP